MLEVFRVLCGQIGIVMHGPGGNPKVGFGDSGQQVLLSEAGNDSPILHGSLKRKPGDFEQTEKTNGLQESVFGYERGAFQELACDRHANNEHFARVAQ